MLLLSHTPQYYLAFLANSIQRFIISVVVSYLLCDSFPLLVYTLSFHPHITTFPLIAFFNYSQPGGITNINRTAPGGSGNSVRLRVKSIAVRCATASLKSLSPHLMVRQAGAGGGSPHVDVSDATRLTSMALTQAQQPQSKKGISGAGIAAVAVSGPVSDDDIHEGLMSVPCYLSLCLHDLVTTACACATFTVDDHLVRRRSDVIDHICSHVMSCCLSD